MAECLFEHIQSQADKTFISKYDGVDDMTTTSQHLHTSDPLLFPDAMIKHIPGKANVPAVHPIGCETHIHSGVTMHLNATLI